MARTGFSFRLSPFLFMLLLATQAHAVCDSPQEMGYKTMDDDAQGRRGLNAQIECLKRAYASGGSAEIKARLDAAYADLEVRKKVWAWEGGAPNLDPTVVCDGKGGMRPALFGHGEEYGKNFSLCLYKHELMHIRDFMKTCPDWCKGRAPGTIAPYLAEGMPKDVTEYMQKQCPAWKSVHDYNAWSNTSECKAYAEQIKCTMELDEKGLDNYKAAFKKGRSGYADYKGRAAKMNPPAECPPSPDDLLLGGDLLKNGKIEPGSSLTSQNNDGPKAVDEGSGKSVGAGTDDVKTGKKGQTKTQAQ